MKGVNVVGIGECGTKIAIELAADFDLGIVSEILKSAGLPVPRTKFLFKFIKKENKKISPLGITPHFFVGDFNRSNKAYLESKKIFEAAKLLKSDPNATAQAILKKLIQRQELKYLDFDKNDLKMIESLKKQKYYVPQFDLLEFYQDDGDNVFIAPDGTGGYQFLSEAVADANPRIAAQIGEHPSRILFGIFGAGGGSGAGSMISILSKDPLRKSRASIGIGIFPAEGENDHFNNAGRLLVRFLSATPQERFDKLLIVANRAAHLAAVSKSSDLNDAKEVKLTEHRLMNNYVSRTIFTFSAINSGKVRVVTGKAFDTLDTKRYLPVVATIGLASSSNDKERSFEELFQAAIEPMSVNDNQLEGIASSLVDNERQLKELRTELRKLWKLAGSHFETSQNGETDISEDIAKGVASITGFYRLLKSLYVFLLTRDDASIQRMEACTDRVRLFLNMLTGSSNVTSMFSGYVNSSFKEDTLLIVVESGTTRDIMEGLSQFLNNAFFKSDRTQTNELFNSLLTAMSAVRKSQSKDDMEKTIKQFLKDVEVKFQKRSLESEDSDLKNIYEDYSNEENQCFEGLDFIPDNIEKSKYRLTAQNVVDTMEKLLRTMETASSQSLWSLASSGEEEAPLF